MFNPIATACLRRLGRPCFRIHGKARHEPTWRVIEVHATARRNLDSRWPAPLFRGTCITWTAAVIAVGWDFALEVLREQTAEPASRDRPVEVAGGRIRDLDRRTRAGATPWASASEILAHEIGHTAQARRLGWLYLPTGALFTLWREGPRWVNWFENAASETGQFGGLVNGSVCPELMERLHRKDDNDRPGR
ncbi:MAG: hypothetical protein U0736_16845 [Gemmataceae bacterium]